MADNEIDALKKRIAEIEKLDAGRKKAEQVHREDEIKFRALFEGSLDGIIIIDGDTFQLLNFNRRSHEMLGYTREEYCKLSIPKDIEVIESPKEIHLHTNLILQHGMDIFETRHRTKRGEIRDISVTAYTAVFDGKKTIYATFHDITERKQAEDKIRKKEELFRTSFENALDSFGIYSSIRDNSGRIVDFRVDYVNDAACKSNQLTKEEQLGKTLLQVLPGHKASGLFEEYCKVVETGKPFVEKARIYKDKYRGIELRRFFDIRVSGLGDGFVASWRDVTEQETSREEIRQVAQEWQDTFNSISDLIFLQNKDYTITKVNKAFADAMKQKPEDIVGKKCYELLHKRSTPWPECPFEKTKIDGKPHTEEVDDPNIGIPLLVTSSPIFDDKGQVIGSVHIAKDISEIKKARQELEGKIRELGRFQKVTMDREKRVIELKARVKELEAKLGGKPSGEDF